MKRTILAVLCLLFAALFYVANASDQGLLIVVEDNTSSLNDRRRDRTRV